jgi:hypothetical protein
MRSLLLWPVGRPDRGLPFQKHPQKHDGMRERVLNDAHGDER